MIFTTPPAIVISIQADVNLQKELSAIAQVETGNDPRVVGKKGERTEYQMTRAVWERYSMVPFRKAAACEERHENALCHLAWLQRRLVLHHIAPTPYNLAAAWNEGAAAVILHCVSASGRDYAYRVDNLYQDAP